MGSILFCWVACGVSLVSLVEIRDLFVSNMEPRHFTQYCCYWILPALILHGETSNLNWIAKMACEEASVLVKNHFVSIFLVCMALHCNKNSAWEDKTAVIQNTILKFAEVSEIERDRLIKKHMVAIVSCILSLASFASDPVLPSFSVTTIIQAIQTVIDGFLATNESSKVGVVDKIKIFRPDSFHVIVEMHYKVTLAVHHRHINVSVSLELRFSSIFLATELHFQALLSTRKYTDAIQ